MAPGSACYAFLSIGFEVYAMRAKYVKQKYEGYCGRFARTAPVQLN
jgi:hypothetical protein